jgi:hypothetical protein
MNTILILSIDIIKLYLHPPESFREMVYLSHASLCYMLHHDLAEFWKVQTVSIESTPWTRASSMI